MEGTGETIAADLLEDGAVLRLTLDNPKGNILSLAVMSEFSEALAANRENAGLRLVLIRAEGPHFSFGASVEEHRKEQAPAMLTAFHGFLRQLAAYPVPIAALVQGNCLGGAFEMVLCCHFVFATATARFGCPEIKLGVFPPALTVLGNARLGAPTTERLLLTGGTIDARDALALGFLTKLFNEEENPEESVLAWYRKTLEPLSAFALRQGVHALRAGSGFLSQLDAGIAAAERQYLDELLTSHDGNEGIEAFLEKRRPVWKNT